MYKRNPILLAKGLAPAAEVGRALNKSLSTIHRLVGEEKASGVRDGKALYVDLESLAKHFDAENNPVLAKTSRELLKKLLAESAKVEKTAAKKAATG